MQGNAVVSYTYDPWGVPTATGNTIIAEINLCTYRGYDYDEDTGCFYLQSRYYDPSAGRFLNADDSEILGLSDSILGYNLFAYCVNNPINSFDRNGYWVISINTTAAGFIIDAFITVVLPYILTAFKAVRLAKIAKLSNAFNKRFSDAVNKLARAIYNGMDSILYKIMGKAANAATRSYTVSRIKRMIENVLSFSIGYAIACIIDRYDKDGKNGYIRF